MENTKKETGSQSLTVTQGCSKWVNKFADTYLTGKPYTAKNLRDSSYDYIRLVNWFPDEDVEDIVVSMFKSNNAVFKYFDKDKVKIKKEVNDLFRNNNCINEFIGDMNSFIEDIVEPIGQNKHEVFLTKAKIELENYDKIDKVYNSGILDWGFVKSQFNQNLEFWKVKEAVSWMVGFVENCDYNLTDLLIIENDKINKNATFKNLIGKINEASLTQNNPFVQKGNNLYFNDAKKGEVDVMLWDEKNKKVISMSATRDRGFKIEGNQFPRHYIKSLVLHDNIMNYYNKLRMPLTSANVQKLVRNENFKKSQSVDKVLNIKANPDVLAEIHNLNEFAKNLTIVRERIKSNLKINFHKNGTNITDKELSSVISYGENKVKFVFYGELLENKHMPTVQAGLNCLSYRDNFKRMGKFRMTNNASNIFMRSISKRFNGISPSEKHIEKYGQDFIKSIIKNRDDKEDNISKIQYFSEGNVYREERECLFKSCSVLFKNVITELDKTDNYLRNSESITNRTRIKFLGEKAIERGIRFFFDKGINNNDVEELIEFFKKPEEINKFILNFDAIKTSMSEVPLELEELDFCKDKIISSFNNVQDRIQITEMNRAEAKNKAVKEEKKTVKKRRNSYNK